MKWIQIDGKGVWAIPEGVEVGDAFKARQPSTDRVR